MNLPAQKWILYAVILPAALGLAALAWLVHGPLVAEEAALDRTIGELQADISRQGLGPDAAGLEQRARHHEIETEELRALVAAGRVLDRDSLVVEYASRPFQLIDFEQAKVAAFGTLQTEADAAGVKIVDSGYYVLADAAAGRDQPRSLWAQLALARLTAKRAIAAKVATYEATVLPAPRSLRLEPNGPVIVNKIRLMVRVTGASDRVQGFLEHLALGGEADGDGPLFIEHVVLRKEGTGAPDLASATVVVVGLLSPQ